MLAIKGIDYLIVTFEEQAKKVADVTHELEENESKIKEYKWSA